MNSIGWTDAELRESAEKSNEVNDAYKRGYEQARKEFERPEGEWQITYHKDLLGRWNSWTEYKCSICKESVCEMHSDAHGEYATKFCPNCGAKMKGYKNETNN